MCVYLCQRVENMAKIELNSVFVADLVAFFFFFFFFLPLFGSQASQMEKVLMVRQPHRFEKKNLLHLREWKVFHFNEASGAARFNQVYRQEDHDCCAFIDFIIYGCARSNERAKIIKESNLMK